MHAARSTTLQRLHLDPLYLAAGAALGASVAATTGVVCPECGTPVTRRGNRFCSRICRGQGDRRLFPPEIRFWKKVDFLGPIPAHCPELGPCWLWTGARKSGRYGHFWSRDRYIGAHVFAWESENGSLPDGLWTLHHCDNPPCVRPSHLYSGSRQDNTRDALARNRLRRKLTWASVREIRSRVANGEGSFATIGADFGVSDSLVNEISKGRVWRE